MMMMLENKNLEDRLKERDQEMKDEKNQLKQQALNELKVQKKQFDLTLKKLKTQLKFAKLELAEERKGQEENQKLTQSVMT